MLKNDCKYLKLLLLTICMSLSLLSSAYATEWTDERYTHFSKNEPLADMLEAMASDQNLSIVVSDRITETISAYYKNKKANEIFTSIANTYGLVTYFDGDALYIYKIDEIKNATISLSKSPISFLETELIEMGAMNQAIKKEVKWSINARNNRVSFRGVNRFIEIANKVAGRLNNKDYVFRWKDKNGVINYSNEPPFKESNYKRVTSVGLSSQAEKDKSYINKEPPDGVRDQDPFKAVAHTSNVISNEANTPINESNVIDTRPNIIVDESNVIDSSSSSISILR